MIRKTLPLAVGLLALAQFAYAVDNTTVQNKPGIVPAAQAPADPNNWSFGTGTPFMDDFESYPTGEICGMGGWEEWSGSVGVCGLVTTEQANSPTKSLKIIGNTGTIGDDTVHRFDVAGGVWTFKTMTFVPANSTGNFYIIMLNQYVTPLNHWSLQVQFNSATNVVHVDFSAEETPLIKGRWVEFRAEIDLTADQVDYFYDGVQFVFDKPWTTGVSGPGGVRKIAALDLYANEPPNGTSGAYFDDVMLVEAGGCEPCDANCDGVVDAFDIEPFIAILTGAPGCSACAADADGNGVVDAFDIEPFIACLTGP